MDDLLTDDQQADRARQWLRENGIFIAAGVVLGLGGLFGWQQWQGYKERVAGEASVLWEQLRAAAGGERFNEVNETLSLLEKDYSGTPYLDQARLLKAQMEMERNSPDEALKQLELLAKSGRDPQLRKVGELRLAQVLAYQGEYDQALKALGTNTDPAFDGLFHDLRGDILYSQGQLEAAATEYELALEKNTDGAIDRNFVQVKLDDVRGSLAAAAKTGDAVSSDSDALSPAGAD